MPRKSNEQKKRELKKRRKNRPASTIIKKGIVTCPSQAKDGVPRVNREEWLRALTNRATDKLVAAIMKYCLYFETNHYTGYSTEDAVNIDEFVNLVHMTFTDERFAPTAHQYAQMIQVQHIYNSLVATSSFDTTDATMTQVLREQNNVPKLLFLQNARTKTQIPPEKFFELNPKMASLWYNNYMLTISQPTADQMRNQYQHLHDVDERWEPLSHYVSSVYFTATYFSPDNVREVKRVFNTALKKRLDDSNVIKINPQPVNPKKIAVVTNKWHLNHAVYKSASPLVSQLFKDYDVTLYHTTRPEEAPNTLMTQGFSNIEYLWFDDQTGVPNIPDSFLNNDYQMIYYPDIGMSNESIWLSNVRAAPIQAMGYGHPDTAGDNSEIDYFIGGQIEEDATDHYAETMVLIPGLAQEPSWPSYERKNNYNDDDVVRINCVWGPDKYNYNLLLLLRQIEERCKDVDVEFHLFSSPGVNRYAALVPFVQDVAKTLKHFALHSQQEYYDYMENAEQHDFSLNSFPFGGYNTVVESLYLGLPMVTLDGGRFYNRAAGHLLKQIGMPELIARTPAEYINIASELVLNKTKLNDYRQALAEMDLKAKLFTLDDDYFKQAVDHIIANHPFQETVKIG
jgi:hypothetical protein